MILFEQRSVHPAVAHTIVESNTLPFSRWTESVLFRRSYSSRGSYSSRIPSFRKSDISLSLRYLLWVLTSVPLYMPLDAKECVLNFMLLFPILMGDGLLNPQNPHFHKLYVRRFLSRRSPPRLPIATFCMSKFFSKIASDLCSEILSLAPTMESTVRWIFFSICLRGIAFYQY